MRDHVTNRSSASKAVLLAAALMFAFMGAIVVGAQRPATAQTAQLPAPQQTLQAASLQDPRERFEVVSIRQSIPDPNLPVGARGGVGGGPGGCKGGPPQIDPGRIVLNNNSLYTLIAWVYGLDCGKAKASGLVSGGPPWVGTDQWVIQATIPESAGLQASTGVLAGRPGRSPISDPKLQRMLQSLLADRFKLALHRETKEIPVYELTVAKGGPKLQQPVPCSLPVPAADGRGFFMPPLKPGDKPYCTFIFGGASMADFAAALFSLDRPVIDRTGIAGTFDLRLIFDPAAGPNGGVPGLAPSEPAGPSIFTALQEQLGLKLESAKGTFEGFEIDSVKRPSEN